jgi:hypothetical protein
MTLTNSTSLMARAQNGDVTDDADPTGPWCHELILLPRNSLLSVRCTIVSSYPCY